jgi:hypothetical protein
LTDRVGHGVDQLDDQLGQAVAGSRLAPEDDGPGRAHKTGGALQPVIKCHEVQNVQELALVFMQPLNLNVEQ